VRGEIGLDGQLNMVQFPNALIATQTSLGRYNAWTRGLFGSWLFYSALLSRK
jgi:hypothetical protein